MTTLTIDTHRFITELKQAGLSEPQAEVITRLHQQAIASTLEYVKHEQDIEEVASKRDIKQLELSFDARIRETELKIELAKAELKRDIAENKAELIRWVVGAGLLQTTIITALLLRLVGHI
jgi:hypothetical protein